MERIVLFLFWEEIVFFYTGTLVRQRHRLRFLLHYDWSNTIKV